MLDFMRGAHTSPFSFIETVENMTSYEMMATANFSEEKVYKRYCKNAWPLIVESLAQAAGIHIKNNFNPDFNGYLVGLNDLHIQKAGELLCGYHLVTKMISSLDDKYVYHCEAFTKTNHSILSCSILLSNSD
ncbi:hypothetical protein ACET7Q_10800 [Aeromonas veronii]|uniref:hypothetical protein n=1 Tax=Aeromonas sp. R2-2 TaxID=3138460 RepID=UPI0034A20C14